MVEELIANLKPLKEIERNGLRVLKIKNLEMSETRQVWETEVLLTANGKSADGKLLAIDSHQHVVFSH